MLSGSCVRFPTFAQPEPGVFALTELSRLLLTDKRNGGLSPWLDVEGRLGRSDVALSGLLEAARTGRPAYESMFGRTFWGDLEADPGRGRSLAAREHRHPVGALDSGVHESALNSLIGA
jgi:hypothetical protein